jgi:hypothetical protein
VSVAQEITLAELEAAVRWQADMERAELRHSSTDLRKRINQSYRRYRELVCDHGHSYFLQSHSGRLTIGPAIDQSDNTTELAWGKLDVGVLDPAVVRVYGLDIHTSGGSYELTGAEWKQRNYYQERFARSDYPQAFFVYDGNTLGLLPPPSSALPYTLWYLPAIRELTADDSVFDMGIEGGDQWVVWDVCHKIASRDNYPPMLIAAERERANVTVELISRAGKIAMVGTLRRLDTRGRNRIKSWRMRWPWGP